MSDSLRLVTRAENRQPVSDPFAWDAPVECYSEPESPIYHLPELRQAWASRPLPAPADPLEAEEPEDDGQDDARTLTTLWVLALSIFGAWALFAHYLAESLTK